VQAAVAELQARKERLARLEGLAAAFGSGGGDGDGRGGLQPWIDALAARESEGAAAEQPTPGGP
jgi:hypothetical protein